MNFLALMILSKIKNSLIPTLVICFLALFFSIQSADAAVTISNSYSGQLAGTGTSITITSVTVASGEMLVAGFGARYSAASFVSSVVFNGSENFTKKIESTSAWNTSLWELKTPTVTTANVVVTYSTSIDRPKFASVHAIAGADTTTGVEATGSKYTSGSTNITTSITTLTDGAMVIDSISQLSDATNPTITPNGAQTQKYNTEVQGTYGIRIGQSYKIVSTAGATSMDWTSTQTFEVDSVAVAIKPAAAATERRIIRTTPQ